MVEVTEIDITAALQHTGFDSVEDLHYWAQDNSELNRFDALTNLLAAYREAAVKAERDRIVAWLRQCRDNKLAHHREVCFREDDDILDAIITAADTFGFAADALESQHD